MDTFLIKLLKSKRKRAYYALMFILLCAPIVILAVFTLQATYKNLTHTTLSTRQSTAHLAAINLKQTFDGLTALGVSFATRPSLVEHMMKGDPESAIKLIESVPTTFPFINRVFLADLNGVLLTDAPHLPGVRGRDFSDRDWYRGVTSEWRPYVSEIYKRTAEPRYNIIAVAVPVRDTGKNPIAILVLQIAIDNVTDWTKNIEVGTGGFIYFVDKKGHVAGHPRSFSEGEILDFSSIPFIQDVLKGESGVGVNFNPIDKEERLTAYEPVFEYGWGAVATQPTINAFADRRGAISILVFALGLIILLNMVAAWFVLHVLLVIDGYRERQEIFLGSIGDAVIAIDRNFVITLFNPVASRMTGFSEREAMGKPMRDIVKFVSERDKSENIAFIEEAMLFGQPRQMENHVFLVTKTGVEVPVGDSVAPIFDQNGIVTGAIIVFRNVSREQDVRRMKDEFVSLASHELRTPMTSIAGFVDMILSGRYGPVTESLREPLGYVAESTDRLIRLVNDLLNVSRIEAGRLKFTLEQFELGSVVSKIVAGLGPIAQKRNITLTVDAQEPVFAQADKEKVEQILHNLIGNSLKFTDKGSISLMVKRRGDAGVVVVTDTGIGIPKEGQEKLFGKFEQINTDSASRPAGTGLGLYLSRQIARKMGGDITLITSAMGEGSVFEFSLPIVGTSRADHTLREIMKEQSEE